MTETISYTPDFLCDGIYYEVKGRMLASAQLKLDLMAEKYPNVELKIIDSVEYGALKLQYKKLIADAWEGK